MKHFITGEALDDSALLLLLLLLLFECAFELQEFFAKREQSATHSRSIHRLVDVH